MMLSMRKPAYLLVISFITLIWSSLATACQTGACCSLTGVEELYGGSIPLFPFGSPQAYDRAKIVFPIEALAFDATTQKFIVKLNVDGVPQLFEVRRKHVTYAGSGCPGVRPVPNRIVCYEGFDLATRSSNQISCGPRE